MIDLLKTLLRDRGARRPAAHAREGDRASCSTLDAALQPTLPGPPGAAGRAGAEDPAWEALDPPQRRQRTLDACKRLLLRESQEQPLLLVFEDLHWIDAETQALLDSLVESLPTARILLLVNYRPEYEHAWGRKTYYSSFASTRCRPRAPSELLDGAAGRRPGLRPLKRAADRADRGQPVLPRGERAHPGRERGAGGRARRLPPGAGARRRMQVPATVQAVLAARIEPAWSLRTSGCCSAVSAVPVAAAGGGVGRVMLFGQSSRRDRRADRCCFHPRCRAASSPATRWTRRCSPPRAPGSWRRACRWRRTPRSGRRRGSPRWRDVGGPWAGWRPVSRRDHGRAGVRVVIPRRPAASAPV